MAKKVLTALYVLFLFIFIMSGCSDSAKAVDIKTDFSADFTAQYRGAEYSGKLSTNRQGVTDISIDSPEEVSGISFGYKNGELEISREDLICSADEAYLPQKSLPSLVKTILDGVSRGNAKLCSHGNDTYTYSFRTDSGECVLETDEKGYITAAEIKDAELSMELSQGDLSD